MNLLSSLLHGRVGSHSSVLDRFLANFLSIAKCRYCELCDTEIVGLFRAVTLNVPGASSGHIVVFEVRSNSSLFGLGLPSRAKCRSFLDCQDRQNGPFENLDRRMNIGDRVVVLSVRWHLWDDWLWFRI